MQTKLMRLAGATLFIALAAAALATMETRLMWGYWIRRPSIASSLGGVEKVFRVSLLPLDRVLSGYEQKRLLDDARSRCTPPSNECLEGRVLLAIGANAAPAPSDSGEDALRAAWERETSERPLPVPTDSKYRDSASRLSGVAIHFHRQDGEYVVLAYRTSEIANDRYIYSEALYRVQGTVTEPIRSDRFTYEIAGLEFLDWPVLWLLNTITLALVSGGVMVRRRWR
jgi:hypothetical protein